MKIKALKFGLGMLLFECIDVPALEAASVYATTDEHSPSGLDVSG
jgi:hypothetical protein